MKLNSRQKGAQGEREFSKFATDRGYSAHRGRQFSGSSDSPDIKFIDLKGIHVEVKRVQALNIENAMQQAIRDAGSSIPVVAHRRNGEQWKITLSASDFFDFFLPGFVAQGYQLREQHLRVEQASLKGTNG